jgi:very-short-patch-repair endonuclease
MSTGVADDIPRSSGQGSPQEALTGTPDRQRKRISYALEQARRDLVDATRRNRLLHAPLTGKRPWCLAVTGHTPDELLQRLHWEEKATAYAFQGIDEDPALAVPPQGLALPVLPAPADRGGSASSVSFGRALIPATRLTSSRYPRLQTRLSLPKLDKRLTKIFREERTLEEEQGLSTLFLTTGFLKWFDSDSSEEASYAPLILIPVTLQRVQGKEGYILTGRDDDIVVNVSLREKLKGDFGIALPDIPEEDGWQASQYLTAVEAAVSRQRRWQVEHGSIGLGFFTFSKFMMWRDLDGASWPEGSILDHKLINVLLDENTPLDNEPPIADDEEPIDQRIDIAQAIHVVDADSSQAVVIEESRRGRNLVVQGPPGTGKSQTITNIISAAVHAGKSVLFVAEKTAALDVVHDRLKRAGLGALCLEMHSRKANKREVLKSLEEALHLSGSSRFDPNLPGQLRKMTEKLNDYAKLIHAPIANTGRSAFDVMGKQLALRHAKAPLLDERFDFVADWRADKIAMGEAAVDRASAAIVRIGQAPSEHPWYGTGIGALSPFDQERLQTTLGRAVEQLSALTSRLNPSVLQLITVEAPTFEDATRVEGVMRLLARAPADRSLLGSPGWQLELTAISRALDRARDFTATAEEVDRRFNPEAWTYDPSPMLISLRADGPSFFRRLSGRYRGMVADLRALLREEAPKTLDGKIAVVERLREAQQAKRDFEVETPKLQEICGELWAGKSTPWERVAALVDWSREALSYEPSSPLFTLVVRSANVATFSAYAEQIQELSATARRGIEEVIEATKADALKIFATGEIGPVALGVIKERLETWQATLDKANDWSQTRSALDAVQAEGLGSIAARLTSGSLSAQDARPAVDLLIAEALWKKAASDAPGLVEIDGGLRTEEVERFREMDRQRIQIARQEVLARYLDQRPTGHAGEMGIIRGEIDKRRGHRAVRKLMTDAGTAVQRLKPIFLMSPLSVAQFLPPGKMTFDLLVMDEASQIAPEEALGAVARARQVVVVGDHKQLPPTNFFKAVNAGDDASDEDEDADVADITRPSDFESILTLSRTRGMAERMLAWHYRSKHPSLIALSNAECYANRLLLPPSPFVQTGDYGLTLVPTPRGHYDRGGTSRDLVQAEMVANAIAKHLRQFPNKSLGVACLSTQQRDAVDDMIDKLGIRSDVESFLPKGERLFVKNLEAIQGDERDVIYIAIGYGVAPNQSKPFLNFGPVSREGGERRLNVLASRAREKCIIFSSISAADIPADHDLRGTRMLRELLHFAATGNLAAGALTGGGFDSPFEEAVAAVIREAGYHVQSQVGVSSFRVDLGVIDPARPGEYVLGVECDGATYHSARSARDRDRLRQEVLEGLGWRLHRIWSTDWFRNPMRETDKLIAAIRQAAEKKVAPELPLDEPDDSSQGENDVDDDDSAAAGELDELPSLYAKPSNVEDYKEASPSIPSRRELLELSASEIGRLALAVVEAEGPVHTDEVARRIREAFGLQKTGNRILAHVKGGLIRQAQEEALDRNGEFWIVKGRKTLIIRDRRHAPLPLRKATVIAPAEYQLAIITVLKEAVSISREELLIQTARLFGFDRTGPDLKLAIEHEVDTMLASGPIALNDDKLTIIRD